MTSLCPYFYTNIHNNSRIMMGARKDRICWDTHLKLKYALLGHSNDFVEFHFSIYIEFFDFNALFILIDSK